MFLRFERDERALRLLPYGCAEESGSGTGRSGGGGDGGLNRWLEQSRCVHFDKNRRKSHLVMASSGDKSHPKFLHIPDDLRRQFHVQFLNDGPHYIAELLTQPCFRCFFDVDYVCHDTSSSEEGVIDKVLNALRVALKQASLTFACPSERLRLLVVGNGRLPFAETEGTRGLLKQGFHIRCPNLVVCLMACSGAGCWCLTGRRGF